MRELVSIAAFVAFIWMLSAVLYRPEPGADHPELCDALEFGSHADIEALDRVIGRKARLDLTHACGL